MEFEEEHNNLRALRLLYRLLEDNNIGLQNANSEDLVERARALLKGMLDVTAERVIETILKIIATQASISKTTCTSQREKPVASLQLNSLMAGNSSQCSLKYPTCSRITSRKDEQPQMKLQAKTADPWLCKSSISDKGKNKRKTLCSVGEESSMMDQNLVNARSLYDEKPILPITASSHREQKHSVSTFHAGERSKEPLKMFDAKAYEFKEVNETPLLSRIYEIQCNPSASSWVEPQDEEGDISNDLVNAIQRIESRILSLELCSNLVLFKKNRAGDRSMHKGKNSGSPVIQKNEGIAGNGLGSGNSLLEGNGLHQQASRLTSKGKSLTSANAFEEPISTGNESLNQVANQIHRPEILVDLAESNGITIQGNSQKGEVSRTTRLVSRGEMLLSRSGVESMAMTNGLQSLNRSVSGNDHLVSQASECIQGLRVPLNQDDITRRSSMLAGPTTKKMPIRKNSVVQPDANKTGKKSSHQMVLKPTLPDERSSEIKMYPHLHRDWSVLKNRGTHKMRTSLPKHQESEESISSSGSSASWTSQQSCAIRSSDSEDYPPYDDNSEGSGDSYSHNDAGPSHRGASLKSARSCRRRDPDKTIGRLRRLKNKLGLIFHHHHHHHHHHHDEEDDSKNAKVDHRHSMWNHLQTIFHGKNKHKLLTKGKAEKTRRGAVARVPPRKQVGHFRGLVEGLLRHIQHSKKRRPSSKVRIEGSREPLRDNRKKLHWWQMLRRHRGVRLNNRGRHKVLKPKSRS